MKQILDFGIYTIDFQGRNDAEFIGTHPALLIQSIHNKEIYYAIPLTSYSPERWDKYRKQMCCRIVSINSIARIDKMVMIHRDDFEQRWISDNKFLIPNSQEIKSVYDRIIEYITLSCNKSYHGYEKFYNEYNKIIDIYKKLLNNESDVLDYFEVHEEQDYFVLSSNLDLYAQITFEDVKNIARTMISEYGIKTKYDKDSDKLNITVYKNNNKVSKKLLTNLKMYANLNSVEAHK